MPTDCVFVFIVKSSKLVFQVPKLSHLDLEMISSWRLEKAWFAYTYIYQWFRSNLVWHWNGKRRLIVETTCQPRKRRNARNQNTMCQTRHAPSIRQRQWFVMLETLSRPSIQHDNGLFTDRRKHHCKMLAYRESPQLHQAFTGSAPPSFYRERSIKLLQGALLIGLCAFRTKTL